MLLDADLKFKSLYRNWADQLTELAIWVCLATLLFIQASAHLTFLFIIFRLSHFVMRDVSTGACPCWKCLFSLLTVHPSWFCDSPFSEYSSQLSRCKSGTHSVVRRALFICETRRDNQHDTPITNKDRLALYRCR